MRKAWTSSVSHTEETIKELRFPAICRGLSEGGAGGTGRPKQPGGRLAGLARCSRGLWWFGDGGRASWHQPGSALPITVTQGQPDFENPAGGAEVGRDAAVGGAGESGAFLMPGR